MKVFPRILLEVTFKDLGWFMRCLDVKGYVDDSTTATHTDFPLTQIVAIKTRR